MKKMAWFSPLPLLFSAFAAQSAPLGKQRALTFVSNREGTPQIYLLRISGGEARRISNLDTGVSNLMWSPDGRWIAFSGDLTWPPSPTKEKDPYPTQVRIWDQLYYRHWNEWRVGNRSHLFLIRVREADRTIAKAKDLTPLDKDIPTLALGGFQDIAFTPDGQSIAFTLNQDRMPAIGTNNDIFLLPSKGQPCPI